VAEMEIEERPNEPFVLFAADKTDPGAYNLPSYLGFADPMFSSGLILSPKVGKGFTFRIMDVANTEGDKVIDLSAPEDLYDIAALLRDQERFVVESIRSRATGEIAAVVSTTRLHNIAGKYTGKDDPVMLVRTQGNFPATGRFLLPTPSVTWSRASCGEATTGRSCRCAEHGNLLLRRSADRLGSRLQREGGAVHRAGRRVRSPVLGVRQGEGVGQVEDLRRQGFFGPAMLPYSELEYGGIVERMKGMESKFRVLEGKEPVKA